MKTTAFESANFIAPKIAETTPLASVLKKMASNDPRKVKEAASEVESTLLQVAASLNVLAELQAVPEEHRTGFADKEDVADALNLLSAVTAICANSIAPMDAANESLGGAGMLRLLAFLFGGCVKTEPAKVPLIPAVPAIIRLTKGAL